MAPIHFRSLSPEKKQVFIDSFDTIITDCDGVIWNSNGAFEGAAKTLSQLSICGKTIYYVTNNSTKTRAQLLSKFQKLGFDVTENRVFNTSSLAAAYVKDVLPPNKTVYVVGSKAISEELKKFNIDSFGPGKEESYDGILEKLNELPIEIKNNVGAVVVGFDEYISYVKILKAATYLQNECCLFVCTNTDETFPSSTIYRMPGSGAILAGIKVTSGREPFVVGKPSTYIADILRKESNINPDRTLFIGDRCNADILMGNKCSFKTLLVLTGVHSMSDVKKLQESPLPDDRLSVPDYYTESISDLIKWKNFP